MYIRATGRRAPPMWVFPECKCKTSARRRCIGTFINLAPATANAITNGGSGCRWLSRWVAIRFTRSRRPHRCQTVWTNCYLPGSCEENQSSWFAAKPSTWRCRRTSTLFWKAMCSQVICVRKGPLAIIPDFTLQSKTRSEEHTSELLSQSNLVCRLLLEKKKKTMLNTHKNSGRQRHTVARLHRSQGAGLRE